MSFNFLPTFAPPTPVNPRTSDVLAMGVPFYVVPKEGTRVFIHPSEGKHGPIRRIIFDSPVFAAPRLWDSTDGPACNPGIIFACADDAPVTMCERVKNKEGYKTDAARTAEQMSEDILLADFDL